MFRYGGMYLPIKIEAEGWYIIIILLGSLIIQLILILWQKVRQTRIFAIVRVFPYYEEAKKLTFFRK